MARVQYDETDLPPGLKNLDDSPYPPHGSGPANRGIVLLVAESDADGVQPLIGFLTARSLRPALVTGVDTSFDATLHAMLRSRRALFVVLRSETLDARRLREIKEMFVDVRADEQELMVLRLRPADPEPASSAILRRLGIQGTSMPPPPPPRNRRDPVAATQTPARGNATDPADLLLQEIDALTRSQPSAEQRAEARRMLQLIDDATRH